MTLEDFDIMAEEQNHKCALCRGVNVNNRRLIVDHDHDTGEVRGLLCYSCNYRLSLAERYPSFFIKCLKYLKKI
ncbi:MAG: hypothetical protein GY843_18800 [Neptuniibacter sp.]|nr:hypothetical protein [Neptuniibacter sp.]